MEIRSLICGFALAAAATVAAAAGDVVVTSSNTCGLMNVPSTDKYTMIAVPWLQVGGGAVKVCDLVKTDTLTAGDKLYYYNGSAFEVWELGSGKTWTALTTVGEANGITTAEAAADKTIARGQALWLERPTNQATEIWLYGQYAAEAASVTVAQGSAEVVAYTMVANPTAADFDLNVKGVAGAAGDQVSVPADTGIADLYTYDGAKWMRKTVTTMTVGGKERQVKVDTDQGCVVPAGRGVWYVSKGGKPTISWN